MTRRSRRKPPPRRTVAPEEREQREREREQVAKRNEQERAEGVSQTDGAGRWLAAKEQGQSSPFLARTSGGWRDQTQTAAQQRRLRALGLNPFTFPTRGGAADAIKATTEGRP